MNMSKEGREGYERKKRKNSFLLLTALTHIQDQLPFAVVGSREEIVVGGHKVRARQYPWGTVEGEWKGGGREEKEGREKEGRERGELGIHRSQVPLSFCCLRWEKIGGYG